MPKRTAPPPAKAAPIEDQPITYTLESNFMPYAMTAIKDRAIVEIDGFKPSHRKLLYTMYKMGLGASGAAMTKSATVVGATMKLNPHGELNIYETLVRLTRGNESLLHPFIDSKGSFGKVYSRDMAYSASRYTNCRLDSFCAEIFGGIEADAVDFADNYDGTTKEPALLPTSFPNILVSPNVGIAVGMASSICSFNLSEVCDATIAMLKQGELSLDELTEILKAPDFPTGGQYLYDREALRGVYERGAGSLALRARYTYDKTGNCVEVYQIPYSTTIEAIIDKVTSLVREGKMRDIADIRDEIDLGGFKLTIDLKRGVDPDKLMARLFKMTPLQSNFACNFNLLIDGSPRLLGVREILGEWIKFRLECVRRVTAFELAKKKEKLHLLYGLEKILLDIDKAIRIIRGTERDAEVVPNLMEGFGIDRIQAEYIADIRLRHINREYIVDRIDEIAEFEAEAAELEAVLGSERRQKAIIARQLELVKKKYGKPRLTQIVHGSDEDEEPVEAVENYPVYVVMSREGYFKKITKQSLRAADEQKLKDGDAIAYEAEAMNADEALFLTDRAQAYKVRLHELDNQKAGALGDFIPARLGFDEAERVIATCVPGDYAGNVVILFADGKCAKFPLEVYKTKTNRRKLSPAFADKSPARAVLIMPNEADVLVTTTGGRAALFNTALVPLKTTRTTIGVAAIKLAAKDEIKTAVINSPEAAAKYKKIKLPARPAPMAEQLGFE